MRAFIAVDLAPELRTKVVALQKELAKSDSGFKMVEKDNLHLTIQFLGDISEDKADEAIESLRGIALPLFTLNFSGVGVFPNEKFVRVVWIACESAELSELAAQVNKKMSRLGLKPDKPFVAHLTIARASRKVEAKAFLEKNSGFILGEQKVENFILKKSELTPNGPVYQDVKEFKLSS
ncbi:RNA 2',3'-cyclic phosphodiesterase [Candidatus Gugararchaeum adminiculabundum]|nr:RNA 2',3'-cyclic phosphodiesterase [Candidatus Gugararchaeum adminiculabundum]